MESLRRAAGEGHAKELWERIEAAATAYMGYPADLRTGMLGRDVAVAFDWLHPLLGEADRSAVVEGLDRCAIGPFFRSAEMDAWWIHSGHNWTTCVAGGLGVAGMALLGDAHPDSPPEFLIFALAARATGNGVFQWYYNNYLVDSPRGDMAFELLWYDPSVAPRSWDTIFP